MRRVPVAFNLILFTVCFEHVYCDLVAVNPGGFVSPVLARSERGAIGTDARVNSPNALSSSPTTATAANATTPLGSTIIHATALIFPRGRSPPPVAVVNITPSSTTSEAKSSSEEDEEGSGLKEANGNGPDGQAVQRTFLVLAGLGVIIIAYLGIKFACVKKRRRQRDEESSYGLVETSEMDLLDNDDEEDEDDTTLFDLHSHRRT